MVITKLALPRRTFLRGMGATVALPFLDAMVPAMSGRRPKAAPRFAAIYCGNGANMFDWTPADRRRRLRDVADPEAARGVPRPDGRLHRAGQLPGDGPGRRRRAASARRAGLHELRAPEADRRRRRAGRHDDRSDDRRPRSAATRSSRRWKSDRRSQRRRRRLRPRLRVRLHELACRGRPRRRRCRRKPTRASSSSGCSASARTAEERLARAREDRSILDGADAGDRRRFAEGSARATAPSWVEYFDAVRDVEQRIAKAESTNSDFSVPEQPVGVPETFKEYIELMFDLQVLAFQADITRVSSFMMARENINRSYPEIGLPEAHHSMSHHGNNPEKMAALREAEHVSRRNADLLPEEAEVDSRRRRQPARSHRRALRQRHERRQRPQQLQRAGHGRGRARPAASRATATRGIPKGTPLANLMLGLMDRFGVQMEKFGDSTAAIDLTTL